MKKVILGTGMLISGIIGFAAIIIAVVSKGTLNGEWLNSIGYEGLFVPFFIYIMLAILGLIIAISGITEKSNND